jgi:Outer membrane protein beta-barrel domain
LQAASLYLQFNFLQKQMIMKKMMLLPAMLFSGVLMAQVRVGIQAGVSMSSPTLKGFTNVTDIKNNVSPTFGIVAQAKLGLLAFRPSVNFLRNNYSYNRSAIKPPSLPGNPDTIQQFLTKLKMSNIEIPLDLVLPLRMKKGKLLLSMAPVITVGLKGDSILKLTQTPGAGSSTSGALSFGSNPFEIKRTDWGARFGIGYQFANGIQLNAAYKRGLSNQRNDAKGTKNHYASLSLAWFLFS